ncbi:unnamed protein product [Parnassius apollo]|uniref:(apollo) hypothetical protein n=1 Tax=Parnassius apollo TaxID=110799 RepID=A0A8S3XBU3_PARAO|nr:unnamed protein product [Parnassius apollo]
MGEPGEIHYPKAVDPFFRRTNESVCTRCDVSSCLPMGDAKCDYYREVDAILQEENQNTTDDNPALRTKVDELLFDLTSQESVSTSECVPYISSYSNCNKVKRDSYIRKKRSAYSTVMSDININEDKLTSEEITFLINAVNDSSGSNDDKNDTHILDKVTESTGKQGTSTTEKNESQNDFDLDFDDLFFTNNSISNGKYPKLNLPMLKNHTEDILDPDYMDMPEDRKSNDTTKTDEETFRKEADILVETSENSKNAKTKLFFYTNLNKKEVNLEINTKESVPGIGDANDIDETRSVRVLKREIVKEPITIQMDALVNNSKNGKLLLDFKENVFDPLTFIIKSKQHEIRELKHMRNNLVNYFTFSKKDTFSNLNHSILENETKSYLTLYKLKLLPYLQNDIVEIKNSSIILDHYVSKLKNDIYEVIKDIVGIQQNVNYKELPEDLNVLIKAMKYYVHYQGKLHIGEKIKKIKERNEINYGKSFSINTNKNNLKTPTSRVQQILYNIDKDMPESNALNTLAYYAKKIIRRIIKKNYQGKFIYTGRRDFVSQNNITNNLENIGIKWYNLTRAVASSPMSDRLYNLKLLHLELLKDIHKLDDTLAIVDLAQSRRIIIDKLMSEKLTSRIKEDIEIITNKVQQIIKSQNKKIHRHSKTINNAKTETKNKMGSFLQQVKNIFKKSKIDIKNIFKKKKISKLHVDNPTPKDLSQYNKKEINWQNNVNTNSIRKKRSTLEVNNVLKRIKNILPNYLRKKFRNVKNSRKSVKSSIKSRDLNR